MAIYTFIGHIDGAEGYDRCGDYYSTPGKFDIETFREDCYEDFLKSCAYHQERGTYETFEMLIDGMSHNFYALTDEEREKFVKLWDDLRPYAEAERENIKAEKAAETEREAQAAVAQALLAAQIQRAWDEAAFEELKRRLGK